MENKFFLHRIRNDGDSYITGIEVHDTLNSAIQSFHSQMKMAYDNPSYPNMKYVSCMVTNENDEIILNYNETWSNENNNDFFTHYIRYDGNTYTKGIDVNASYAAACRSFHAYMEYGYDNSKFPSLVHVASKMTDNRGAILKSESWKAEEEGQEEE